jgi:hypothetical protein
MWVLRAVIIAYERLKIAYGEQRASPGAARAETEALGVLGKGRKELSEGLKLLG